VNVFASRFGYRLDHIPYDVIAQPATYLAFMTTEKRRFSCWNATLKALAVDSAFEQVDDLASVMSEMATSEASLSLM
jgi:hypothetical protein